MSSEKYIRMRSDVLINIATFLARRWSGNIRVTVVIAQDKIPNARPDKNQISLPLLNYYQGTDFQKYRQWRVALWQQSMRMRYSTKVLSSEHAYGFLLNTIESKRVEILGLEDWQGMIDELIFNEGISWLSRPLLNSLYGIYKKIEAFSQLFLTGYFKGELYDRELDRINGASDFANNILQEAIKNNYTTEWLEKHIPKLVKILEIDSLTSIPIIAPRTRIGISINQSDLVKQLQKLVNKRTNSNDIEKSTEKIIKASDVLNEFESLMRESQRTENKGYDNLENLGLSIPENMDIDESHVYDLDLIRQVKAKFRDWKTGWIERHEQSGDEFDVEIYAEGLPKTFITDFKLTFETKVTILLDHSSSIQDVELEYKRATIALCEALHFLGIKFSVYAFSTEYLQVKCWIIKPPNIRWSQVCARRLAQIKASGGTPLAEIYALLTTSMKAFKPQILVTLTDGEPSDSNAVRQMVLSYRTMGIHMVALGLGRSLNDSLEIGNNLKYLGYERSLAVSRLQDIPKKVIGLLRN